MVDAKLRQEYEKLQGAIDNAEAELVKALRAQSSSKRDIVTEISSAFTNDPDQFIIALRRIEAEIKAQRDVPYANVRYDVLFDEKAEALLAEKDVKAAIDQYVKKYNQLLDASTYFSRDTFNYYNAASIVKSLTDHGFFKAKHTVTLHGTGKQVEVKTPKQLEQLIDDEKKAIISDASLRTSFDAIQKALQKNEQVRGFEQYLLENEVLVAKLSNIPAFKQEVWKSYIKANEALYLDLLAKAADADERKAKIEQEAATQGTQWERVIAIYNERFFVPFKLVAQNRIAVMLGREPILKLGFTFDDGAQSVPVNKSTLLQSLSTGEKKAFYILNVIFEIEARAQAGQETLLIVDDVADSFDYKNKYAIIQYLADTKERGNFYEIVLTHNFDFFRTVQSRFVPYSHCLMVDKNQSGIALRAASGIKNIFVNDWKEHFADDAAKRVASIPFIRNILEYTRGEDDQDYITLTSLLHWKSDSAGIMQAELDAILQQGIFYRYSLLQLGIICGSNDCR